MKQLVCEKWRNGDCTIKLTYPKSCNVFNLKERYEKTIRLNKCLVVIYWIEVANNPPENTPDRPGIKRLTSYERRQEKINKLKSLRDERINRMRKIVEEGKFNSKGFYFSQKDIEHGMELMSLIGRQKKSLNSIR